MVDNEELSDRTDFVKSLVITMSRSILPLLANTEEGKMRGIGSCTLLSVNGYNHIVTAAHVLRQYKEYPLYISTEQKTIEITWSFVMSKGGKEGCDYTLDIAFAPIFPELLDLLSKDHNAISISDTFDKKIDYDEELLFAFGYPSSKVNYDKHRQVVNIKPMNYFGRELADLRSYGKSCSCIDKHLLIKFLKRKTNSPKKSDYVIAPDPYGLSGGGLFRVLLKNHIPLVFILEGILTEWHEEIGLMKGAKTIKVKDAILGHINAYVKEAVRHNKPGVCM